MKKYPRGSDWLSFCVYPHFSTTKSSLRVPLVSVRLYSCSPRYSQFCTLKKFLSASFSYQRSFTVSTYSFKIKMINGFYLFYLFIQNKKWSMSFTDLLSNTEIFFFFNILDIAWPYLKEKFCSLPCFLLFYFRNLISKNYYLLQFYLGAWLFTHLRNELIF